MHAVAWHLHTHQRIAVWCICLLKNSCTNSSRPCVHKNIIDFREHFRSVDVLMIDDVQFISGKDSTQEEFSTPSMPWWIKRSRLFCPLSPLKCRAWKSVCAPAWVGDWWPTFTPPPTNCAWASCSPRWKKLDIEFPTRGFRRFLAHKITSNVREMEGALNRILAHATLVGGRVSVETTQHVLKDLLRANERVVTIEEIQRHVAEHFNVREAICIPRSACVL